MANDLTNNALGSLAETLAVGAKTIKDLIEQEMRASGTQEAAGFNVTINGVTHQVVSDADPALTIEIQPSDEVRVQKVNSADAGRV